MKPGVFCTNPQCKKRIGDRVAGFYETTCPRCGSLVQIVTADDTLVRTSDGLMQITVRRR
jgi:hypothetical protein